MAGQTSRNIVLDESVSVVDVVVVGESATARRWWCCWCIFAEGASAAINSVGGGAGGAVQLEFIGDFDFCHHSLGIMKVGAKGLNGVFILWFLMLPHGVQLSPKNDEKIKHSV